MKNIWLIIAVVALLALGGWYYMGMQNAPEQALETGMPVPGQNVNEMEVKDANGQNADAAMQKEVKEFTVEGSNFAFAPNTMTVKKGDTVRIVFKNKDGFHDLVIDEFEGAKTKQISAGAEETIEFVADTAGTFEYYCSVGSHRAKGMVGTLVVTE